MNSIHRSSVGPSVETSTSCNARGVTSVSDRTAHRLSAATAAAAVLAFGLALGGCQPKPTTAAAATVVPSVGAPVVATQLAPGQIVQLADGRIVQVAGAPATQAPPTPATPVPPMQIAPVANVAMAAQPVPVYNDGGPPPSQTPAPVTNQAPVVAPAATRAPVHARAAAPVPSGRLGRVASIEPLHERPQGTGVGGVAGGALGALVGNQFGHGNGKAALTVLGLAGGAVAGNNVERNLREKIIGYRVEIELDNGETRSVQTSSAAELRVGDRVRVSNEGVRRI